jgi:hypothetical protein
MPRRAKNGRASVQHPEIQKRRTDLSIDVSVHEPGSEHVTLPVEQVRANLRAVFRGQKVVVVGDNWHPRAIIIPLGEHRWLSEEEKKERSARLKAQLKTAVEQLIK